MMKRNTKAGLALIVLSLMVLGSSPALARHHWGNGGGMWQQNGSGLSAEQQAAAQKSIMTFTTRLTPYANN